MKTVRYILLALGLIWGSLFFLYPQILYTHTLYFSSLQRVGERIYISEHLDASQYRQISDLVLQAENRIANLYGSVSSSPRIIICGTDAEYRKYCNSNVGAGCSVGTPWGIDFVVVHFQGINTDVLSHEMSHIELLQRLGWWTVLSDIPQWFNEGVALMVDRRFVSSTHPRRRARGYAEEYSRYAGKYAEDLSLKELEGMEAFSGGDPDRVLFVYMMAGKEVSSWLLSTQNQGLRILIDSVNKGERFNQAYGVRP